MATPFVILFEGRCGSTHLTLLLDSHPRTRARREILSRIKSRGGGAADQLRWARRQLSGSDDGSLDAVGFKTKLRDVIDRDAFADLLRESGSHVIHLERENLVKLAVSSINAQRLAETTKRYNLFDEADRLPPLTIDLAEMKWNLAQREAWQLELGEFIAALDRPCLRVTYEELLAEEPRVLADVFAFLGVAPAQVDSGVLKNTSDDLREAITNFDELRAHFVGTRYEQMFDEVTVSPG